MDSVGSRGDGDVGARIDEEFSSQFSVLSSQFGYCLAGKRFQIACPQVFLSQLDEIDASVGSFRDLVQQLTASCRLLARELGAIGDVVEEQWPSASTLQQTPIG